MKKKLISLILICLIMFSGTNVLASPSSDTTDIKNVLNQYFDNYFKSLETLTLTDTTNIMEDNDDTLLYKKMNEFWIEGYKAGNLNYTNYDFNLNFLNVIVVNNKASVNLLMNCDYNYSTTPNIKSSMDGINYTFDMVLINKQWKIIKIDSNFDGYDDFKKSVNDKIKTGTLKKDAITITSEQKNNELKEMTKNLSGSLALTSEKRMKNVFRIATVSTSFNKQLGMNYAQRFAQGVALPSRFFYTAGNDCTNFVSQCVWAAYGGYVEGNDIQTKSNIANRVRMVNSIWQAGSYGGGGTPNWESVDPFWTYVTTNSGNGPKATGYNNNNPYYNFAPNRIYMGEVLQFRNGSSGAYQHSVFVTYGLDWQNQYYNQILVSQHSSDILNRNLWELIVAKGGNSCYMRDIAFSSTQFNS